MIRTFFAAYTTLLDVLLPPRATERAIRNLTLGKLTELASPQGPLPYHEPVVRALVWEIKYRKNPFALRLAGAFLFEQALSIAQDELGIPVLIPVPMHHSKKRQRGYNQTEELCLAIMQDATHSFQYEPSALVRIRNTVPQQGLPRHRRLKNMLNAIESAHPELVSGRNCIVVDDVVTTGATTHETKRALLEAGAKQVHILTLAHS